MIKPAGYFGFCFNGLFQSAIVILLFTGLITGCGGVSGNGSYTVQGSVFLKTTPIPEVTITLTGENITAVKSLSGSDGSFEFTDLWNGSYTLTASKTGYLVNPESVKITVNNGNVTVPTLEVVPLWDRSIGGLLDDWAKAIIPDGSGGYIIAGTCLTDSNGYDGFAARIGFDGTVLWQKTYGVAGADRFSSVTACGSGFLFVGTTERNGSADIYLVRVDADGESDSSWVNAELVLGTSGNEYGTCAVSNSDGSCVVAGYGANGTSLDDVIAFTVSSNGTAGSIKYYEASDSEYANAIISRVNSQNKNEYIIAGARSIAGVGRDILLVKLDDNLTESWRTVSDKSSEDEARALCVCSNGEIAVTGYRLDSAGARDVWVGIFSPEGGVLGSEISIGGNCEDIGTGIVALADGGFAVAGYSVNESSGRIDLDYFLTAFKIENSKLSSLWLNKYDRGSEMNDYCTGVVTTIDGGYALAGYSSTATSKNDIWIIKRDSTGSIGGE